MPKTKKKQHKTSDLLDTLRLVALAQDQGGDAYEIHCRLRGGFLSATNGILAAGGRVTEDFDAVLPTFQLIKALERITDIATLTFDGRKLVVRSGKMQVSIPCLKDTIIDAFPDPVVGEVGDKLRDALTVAGKIASDTAARMIDAAVLLRSGSAVGTNGHLLIEAWHGFDMPTLIVPKAFITALGKVKKSVKQFGFSERSFTLYFEGGAWLRTQLYDGTWPDVDRILNVESEPKNVDMGFFHAAETVAAFSPSQDVFLQGALVHSHSAPEDEGAYVTLDTGLSGSRICMDGKLLAIVAGHAQQVDMEAMKGKGMLFFGENVRGAMVYRA